MRVLIVDDESGIRRTCAMLLARFAKVTTVATSIEALAALEQLQFDVVLVDLRLEAGVQGAVLLSEIAARWPRTRRIAFSASPHLLDDRSLVEAVLEKPWSNEALITLIRGC